jgi:uncharacterized protein YdeI (YjbR/CyaY-like superfamily)
MNIKLEGGVVHTLPKDLEQAILRAPKSLAIWQDITPLARNEWICWVDSAKQEKTRLRRIEVGISKMNGGMRRPCCWQGCAHRPGKKPWVKK